SVERNARERERRGGADDRRNVGIDLGIDRDNRRDDLHVVVKAVGKERPDRPVDETRGQRLLLRRATLALEEATGDLAGGVGLLLIVDGEWKEVLSRPRLLRGDRRDQHEGVTETDHHRTASLARDLACFERQCMGAVSDRFPDGIRHIVLAVRKRQWPRTATRPLSKMVSGMPAVAAGTTSLAQAQLLDQ